MDKRTLDIGRQIEMTKGTEIPMVDGHPMTIGELIMRIIPTVSSGNDYMRVMNLGFDIDRAIGASETEFEISTEDEKLLKKTVIDDNRHPVWGGNWAKWNLEKAFTEE